MFGNKYVSFTSPKDPTKTRISSADVIDVSHVTTEFNTLFETLTSISEKVDPVKLNLTLSAAAEALNGLGTKFGQSIVNGNAVLDDINPQMPQIRTNIQQLSKLADVYTKASPDLWDFLDHAVTTARTLNQQQKRPRRRTAGRRPASATPAPTSSSAAAPYFVRGQADLIPTATLLDTYSPQLYCQIRNYAEALPLALDAFGGNGYSLDTVTEFLGAPNPYVYPDNLPRVNARGGPGGAPGCWQEVDPRTSGRRRTWWSTTVPRWPRTTTSNSASRSSPSTSGDAKSGRTRSTHENHRHRNQTRRILVGAAALHGDHRHRVRAVPLRPDHRLHRGVQQCQRAARRPVRPGRRCRGRQGLQRRSWSTTASRVQVTLNVDRTLPLYQSTTAQIRYQDLIGNRYVNLDRGTGEGADRVLPPGGFIPMSRTQPALDLDALIGGFKPLFKSLDPEKVNNIASSLVTVFQGQGGTINDILDQTAQLTSTLADRDQAIGEVITNLNTVLATTVKHEKEFDQTVNNFEMLITGLKNRADPLADAIADISNAAGTLGDLLADDRPLLKDTIGKLETIQQPLVDGQAKLDDLLTKLPDGHQDHRPRRWHLR